jgi:hypothetical protein
MLLFPKQTLPMGHGTHLVWSEAGMLPGPQVVHALAPGEDTCTLGDTGHR